MYVMTDRVGAIVLMVLSLWCLGSWPAFFNVLERRGRVPMHTYMDYTIATYCVAIGFALTLGEIGPSSAEYPNFTTQLFQVLQSCFLANPSLTIILVYILRCCESFSAFFLLENDRTESCNLWGVFSFFLSVCVYVLVEEHIHD